MLRIEYFGKRSLPILNVGAGDTTCEAFLLPPRPHHLARAKARLLLPKDTPISTSFFGFFGAQNRLLGMEFY